MSPTHMYHDHEQAFSTLIRAAGPLEWSRLTAALREEFIVVLSRSQGIPDSLLDPALGTGDAAILEVVTRNRALRADPSVRARLAATGHPAVVLAAAEDPALRRAALEHADTAHPGWHGEGGAIAKLLAVKNLAGLRPLVHAPFPVLIEHALSIAPAALSEREHGHALRGMYVHAGAESARTWAELLGGKAGELALAELDSGGDLSGLLAWAEGTESAIRELRAGGSRDLDERVAQRSTLDWAAIGAAHAAEPFDEPAALALIARGDCSPEIVAALHGAHPLAVAEVARDFDARIWHGTNATAAVLAKSTRILTRRAVSAGMSCELLTEANPATAVLAGLRDGGNEVPADRHPSVAELAAMTAGLGGDPAAWRALRLALKSARGTVVALFARAASILDDGKAPATWPDAAPAPADGKAPTLSGAREAFLAVFDRAPIEVRVALLPHLDPRTRSDVFTRAAYHPRLLEAAIAGGEPDALLLAARADLDAGGVQALLELDSPAVNGRLFGRSATTRLQRQAILSGRRLRGGEGRLPLDRELRTRLLSKSGGWHGTDAVDCADAELQEHILRHVRVRGEVPQLRMLLNAWVWHGKEQAVRLASDAIKPANYSRLPVGRPARAKLRKLTSLAAPEARLAELRAELDAALTPEWQIAELRREHEDHFEPARQSHAWHWPEIVAAHREEPLPARMLGAMHHEINDLPEELAEAAVAEPYAWDDELSSPGGPLARLRAEALDEAPRNEYWLSGCLASGLLDLGQVLAFGFPAVRALSLAGRWFTERPKPLSELVAGTLGDRPDAWLLALRMLPEFRGTVAELLSTAAAAG